MKIEMVDLKGQYENMKDEINCGIQQVLDSTVFINGPQVKNFTAHLATYCNVEHVIPCANGTDALQIALMSLGLERGDEVIVPAFTYAATAEVVGLLGLTPVMVDVDYDSFNLTLENIRKALTSKTRVVVPVHLFGQSCHMESIMEFAREHQLFVVEDNAQAIGADYTYSNGEKRKTGTMGTIGCTSFFPSKNLGCYGDGGALMTHDDHLAEKIKMIANHGQKEKYHHSILGCNSRLDTIQAAVLDIKLKYLDHYNQIRHQAAHYYSGHLNHIPGLITPAESDFSTHVYHQYTLKVLNGERDRLKRFLGENDIPTMIYYPLPLQKQEAFQSIARVAGSLDVAEKLSCSVLSLPVHTEITRQQQDFIINKINEFYRI